MKAQLESYLRSLADFRNNTSNNRWLVIHFGYFLGEILRDPITPEKLRQCYEAVCLPAPRNVSDVMSKSRAFVRTRGGWKLHYDVTVRIEGELSSLGANNLIDITKQGSDRTRNVVVVYGRDEVVRAGIFQFLRALRLNPIEWGEAVTATGRGSPYVGQVLDSLFELAQVVVVLFTPDESAKLKEALKLSEEEDEASGQPRPNVLIECGMALAKDEAHTIIVQVGKVRPISDLSGRHVIRLDNSAKRRHELAQRLTTAGCPVSITGNDWLSTGDFAAI